MGEGAECQWCPWCQLIAAVRQTSPETIDHLAASAAGVLGSVRTLLDAAADSARQARAQSAGTAGDARPQPRADSPGTARSTGST